MAGARTARSAGAMSTLNASVAPTLPAESTARTSTSWAPTSSNTSVSPVVCHVPPSRRTSMRSTPDAASAAWSEAVTGLSVHPMPDAGASECETVGTVASRRTSTDPALASTGAPATTARYSTSVDAVVVTASGAVYAAHSPPSTRASIVAVGPSSSARLDRHRAAVYQPLAPVGAAGSTVAVICGTPTTTRSCTAACASESRSCSVWLKHGGPVDVPGEERGPGVPARVVEAAVGGLAGVRRVADGARVVDDHGVAVLVDGERVVAGAGLAGHVVGREQRVARLRPSGAASMRFAPASAVSRPMQYLSSTVPAENATKSLPSCSITAGPSSIESPAFFSQANWGDESRIDCGDELRGLAGSISAMRSVEPPAASRPRPRSACRPTRSASCRARSS